MQVIGRMDEELSTVAAVCRKQQGGFNGECKRRKRKVLREGKAKRQSGKEGNKQKLQVDNGHKINRHKTTERMLR